MFLNWYYAIVFFICFISSLTFIEYLKDNKKYIKDGPDIALAYLSATILAIVGPILLPFVVITYFLSLIAKGIYKIIKKIVEKNKE